MKKSVPKYRGQRISHADLVAESREQLREAGVGNHERAMFITELSKAVVGNKNPLLYQIQPKMRFHTSKAWKKAYDLVFTYIAENNLEKTLETVGIEMGETLQQTSQRLADQSGIDFNYILNVDRTVDTFNQRVQRYAHRDSDSESDAHEHGSPSQVNKGVQNTPERKISRSSSPKNSPKNSPKKEEPKPRRIKRVKRAKKPESEEDTNLVINPNSTKNSNVSKNIVIDAPENGELSPRHGLTQKLPPMKPTDPAETAAIDKSNYPKPLSPSRGQGAFTSADKSQQQKAKQATHSKQIEQKRKLKVKGRDYLMDSLRSDASDYEISTQSEFEVSEQDIKRDMLSSSTE